MKLTYDNYDTYFPEVEDIKSAAEAEQLAIDFSNWEPEQDLAMNEVAAFGDYFKQVGEKFGLTEVFAENGVI